MKKPALIVICILALLAGTGVIVGGVVLATTLGDATLKAAGIREETYTQTDVDAALLTLGDLPGYSVIPADPSEGEVQLAPCGTPMTDPEMSTQDTQREAGFTEGEFGPLLNQVVGLVDDPEGFIDHFRSIFKDCPSWTDVNGDEFTASEANFGSYGDETYSVKLTTSSEMFTVGVGVVLIRQGNIASMIVMAGVPDISGEEIIPVAEKAAAKLPN